MLEAQKKYPLPKLLVYTQIEGTWVCVNYRRFNAAALRVGVKYQKLNAGIYGKIQVMVDYTKFDAAAYGQDEGTCGLHKS